MGRVMGLDVGDKTIGVAISDPLLITAQGLETIHRENYKRDLEALKKIIREYGVSRIVIGLPKNMNNSIGPQGEKTLKFVKKLRKDINLETILIDERLTTVSAERTLIKAKVRRGKRKQVIDKIAATYILQNYLDRNYGVKKMNDTVVLLDEMGNEMEFQVIATFDLDDSEYTALLPVDDMESLTYLLKIDYDEDGELVLIGINDDKELQRVIEVFEEIQKEKLQ